MKLYVQHQHEVFRYILALLPNTDDATEILQETATILWEKFDAYDSHRPFAPWACRFALNVVRRFRERNQRWRNRLDDKVIDQLADEQTEQSHEEIDARSQALVGCVRKLPEKDRELIDQHYQQRTTIKAIAEQSGRKVNTLYKAVQRIRRMLMICINQSTASEGTQ